MILNQDALENQTLSYGNFSQFINCGGHTTRSAIVLMSIFAQNI